MLIEFFSLPIRAQAISTIKKAINSDSNYYKIAIEEPILFSIKQFIDKPIENNEKNNNADAKKNESKTDEADDDLGLIQPAFGF